MSLQARLGRILGAVSTVSGIVYLVELGVSNSSRFPAVASMSILLLILYIGIFSSPAYVIVTSAQRKRLKRMDRVQAHLFFPNGTPQEDRTLDYHKKHFHHRLVVNHKTNPPKAYFLSTDSLAWKIISKFPDQWVSENDSSPNDDDFTEKWCRQEGYQLGRMNASKDDLLEVGPLQPLMNPSGTPLIPNHAMERSVIGAGTISRQDSRWILSVQRHGRSYAMLYNNRCRSLQRPRFKVRVRVTPVVLYRFALGVWTSINPNEARNRIAILEVDDDAFRLTYTMFPGITHQHIQLTMSPPTAHETYIAELEIQENPYRAYARVYDRENKLLREQEGEGLGLPYASDDVFVGVAVWTDDVSCPLSSYEIEDFEIL